MVKNPPVMWETWVRSLGWEDRLEEGLATHSSVLAWRIPMDRAAWWATVHGVTRSDTTLENSSAEQGRPQHCCPGQDFLKGLWRTMMAQGAWEGWTCSGGSTHLQGPGAFIPSQGRSVAIHSAPSNSVKVCRRHTPFILHSFIKLLLHSHCVPGRDE